MAVTTTAFLTSLGINGAVGIICLLVLSYFRVHRFTKLFFAPKRYNPDITLKPRRLPRGLKWMWKVWCYPENEIVEVCGLDTAIFVRILDFGVRLFTYLTLWCCIILFPVNVTDTLVDELLAKNKDLPLKEQKELSDIDKLSVTNIHAGSRRLWAHMLSVYVVTIVTLWMLWRFCKEITHLRIRYLSKVHKDSPSHTVLITDIPGVYNRTLVRALLGGPVGMILSLLPKAWKSKVESVLIDDFIPNPEEGGKEAPVRMLSSNKIYPSDDEDDVELDEWKLASSELRRLGSYEKYVEQEMQDVYGDVNVNVVDPVYDIATLAPLLAQYNKVKLQIEAMLDWYAAKLTIKNPKKPLKRVEIKVPGWQGKWAKEKYGKTPVKVDYVEFLIAKLQYLKNLIHEEQPNALKKITGSAFVTFRNRYTQVVASTSLHSHDETVWKAHQAPGHAEIIWDNLPLRGWQRSYKSAFQWGLYVFMIIIYVPLCGAIQGIVNIAQLKKTPIIKDIVALPFISQVIIGILPGIVMLIFLAILPMILTAMCKASGMISISLVDHGVVKRFFIFQFMAVFIAPLVAGTFLNNAKTILANPSDISGLFSLIATGIPQTATYFMTYILLLALAGKPIASLRIVGLILYTIFFKLAATPRAKRKLWSNQSTLFGTIECDHAMVMLFGLVFCVQAPLITPVVLLYFVVVSVIDRYNLIYVYTIPYDSAGKLWNEVFGQVIFALYIFQIVIIFLLAVKGFPYVVLLAPTLIMTFAFWATVTGLYKRPWLVLPLKIAGRLDKKDQARAEKAAKEADAAGKLPPIQSVVMRLKAAPSDAPQDAMEEVVTDESNVMHRKAAAEAAALDGDVLSKDVVPAPATPVVEEKCKTYLAPTFKLDEEAHAALLAEAGSLLEKLDVVLAGGDAADKLQLELIDMKEKNQVDDACSVMDESLHSVAVK